MNLVSAVEYPDLNPVWASSILPCTSISAQLRKLLLTLVESILYNMFVRNIPLKLDELTFDPDLYTGTIMLSRHIQGKTQLSKLSLNKQHTTGATSKQVFL